MTLKEELQALHDEVPFSGRNNWPEWISGNIFIRKNLLGLLGVIMGHCHNFFHTSWVPQGKVHVKAKFPDGRIMEGDFGEGCQYRHFGVAPDVEHEITNISPSPEEVDKALDEFTPQQWKTMLIKFKTRAAEVDCLYSHRTAQGRVTEENDGWGNANPKSYG